MKDRKTVTLSDIAEVLHLSPTVISMVLNGKARKYRVSEEVERKVMHCAREIVLPRVYVPEKPVL